MCCYFTLKATLYQTFRGMMVDQVCFSYSLECTLMIWVDHNKVVLRINQHTLMVGTKYIALKVLQT